MAIFNTDYFTTLDQGYYSRQTMEESQKAGTFSGTDFPEAPPVGTALTAREIGTTMAPDTYPLQELQAKIRSGAAKLEIAFGGVGKSGFGGRGATPEVLGKKEREEFRQLAKLNEVQVTTHATFGKQGLSGFTQNGFSYDEAQRTLKEINKAIEFAATATQGGAVVFHTGEWQRPIMHAGVDKAYDVKQEDRDKKMLFKEYDKEWDKAPIYLADEGSGQMTAITRDQKFHFPVEKYDPKTGMNYVEMNKDTGRPEIREYNFNDAVKYIRERFKGVQELNNKSDPEVLIYGLREQQLREAEGQVYRFTEELGKMKKTLEKIQDRKKIEKEVWDKTPESERWKLMEKERLLGMEGNSIPRYQLYEEEEAELKRKIQGHQATAASAQEQYFKTQKEAARWKPIEEVGIKRTADTLARAGLKAMEATAQHRKDLKESIYIAPENLFPDFYGSHADEMINIIQKSREEMANRLKAKGMHEKEAKDKAAEHIRATLDTGHLNQWRQHWKGDPKEFNKWYLGQVQKLVDKKVLGHIHLTDNWGYDDEHLTPGQGNTPIKDVFKMLEKAGFKDFITEVGSFNANTILPDTLAELGSPTYAMGRGPPISFGRMRQGHFGMNAPANYIVGGYAPSNDFRLWSEVPLE